MLKLGKETTPGIVLMDTSRVDGVKAPAHAASALSQIFRGLLNPAARPAEFQGVVIIGDLRVDRRELVDLELDLVAVSKRSGGDAGQVKRAARVVSRTAARAAPRMAASLRRRSRAAVVRGAALPASRGGGGTRRGAGSSLKSLAASRDAQALALLSCSAAARRTVGERCAAPAACGQIRPRLVGLD